MKSPFVSFLFLVFLLSMTPAQSFKQRNQFVGRVKAIQIDLLYLDKEGKPRRPGRHLSCLRAFDPNGNLTMTEDFYAYGNASYGKDTFSYDAAGRMIEKIHEINGSAYKTTYSYDAGGRVIWQGREGHGRRSSYLYDSLGRPKEEKRFTVDGAEDGRQVFSYDSKGRLTRTVLYESNGAVAAEDTKAYDAEGHLVSETGTHGTRTYDSRGNLILEISGNNPSDRYYRRVVYEYNANNLIAKQEEYDAKGLWETIVYGYEYDAHANWIKQTATQTRRDEEGQTWESYRTITYY